MLEVEMKFAVVEFAPVESILQSWGARPAEAIDEADHYFNAPDRDFAKTDEALRLRRIGYTNVLTYKGPKSPGVAKTRTEVEVPIHGGEDTAEDMERLLVHLGYRPVAVVRKRRRIYHFRRDPFDLQACLDEVAEVGRFVEIEIVTPPEHRADAERILFQVTRELGLGTSERRSYLEMYLANNS